MTVDTLFQEAIAGSKTLSSKPDNETLLQLYSLYKQATEGDNTGEAPSNPFDFVARAKHQAWESLKGTSIDSAKQQYIDLVTKLKS